MIFVQVEVMSSALKHCVIFYSQPAIEDPESLLEAKEDNLRIYLATFSSNFSLQILQRDFLPWLSYWETTEKEMKCELGNSDVM